MTKSLKSRVARLEETHQRAILARNGASENGCEAAIERIRQGLTDLGVEQDPTESLAETLARALGIGTDKLMAYLHEMAIGPAAVASRGSR